MLVTIKGKYLSTMKGNKNGKEWVASKLLIGDEVVTVFGIDFGQSCKVMDEVTTNAFLRGKEISCRVRSS